MSARTGAEAGGWRVSPACAGVTLLRTPSYDLLRTMLHTEIEWEGHKERGESCLQACT